MWMEIAAVGMNSIYLPLLLSQLAVFASGWWLCGAELIVADSIDIAVVIGSCHICGSGASGWLHVC